MYLTARKRDVTGAYGAGTALAMKIQVAVGECFDAKHMVKSARFILSNQEADLWFVEKLLKAGACAELHLR